MAVDPERTVAAEADRRRREILNHLVSRNLIDDREREASWNLIDPVGFVVRTHQANLRKRQQLLNAIRFRRCWDLFLLWPLIDADRNRLLHLAPLLTGDSSDELFWMMIRNLYELVHPVDPTDPIL